MAADSLVSDDSTSEATLSPKLFTKADGKLLIGVVGSLRGSDVIRDLVDFDAPPTGLAREYIVHEVARKIRRRLKDEDASVDVLVGYQGRLFVIGSDYGVHEACGYTAIGTGSEVALGALYTFRNSLMSETYFSETLAIRAARGAARAACRHSVGVGEPVSVKVQRYRCDAEQPKIEEGDYSL